MVVVASTASIPIRAGRTKPAGIRICEQNKAAQVMKTTLRTILSLTILTLYGFAFVGCNKGALGTKMVAQNQQDDQHDDHDHDDDHGHDDDDDHGHDHDDDHDHDHDSGHDHDDDHATEDDHGHDHPAHGPNGGHIIELGGDAKAEWVLDNETDLFSVIFLQVKNVEKVEMQTSVAGSETVYEFEKSDTPAGPMFGLASPELATAVKMGDAVKTKVVVTTAEGELTGQVVYHAH
jgi:hypothetical protein